jgi:CBS domain-containing protein
MSADKTHLQHRLAGEQQTLTLPLRALIRNAPVVCGEQSSVREAVAIMHQHGVGSVVVTGADSRPVGIFSERDLVAAVARGEDARCVSELMTRDPLALPAHAFAYEAALTMIARHIRHVLVTDDAALIGVVSERDLFSLQRLGLGELTTEIRLAGDVDILVASPPKSASSRACWWSRASPPRSSPCTSRCSTTGCASV